MIEGLKPYAEYKEVGLPWLPSLPSHWVIKRGKSYLFCIDERSKAGKEELLTVSSARGVVPRSSAKVTMFKAESYAGHKLCWPGDLVINSLWAWGGGLGVSQHHGIISTAYSVYRSRPSAQINPRYLHVLVRSSAFHWELQVRSKGVWISRLQLTDTSFLDAPIPLPPPAEQLAIIRFLDHANRKIDGFIRAKRKLIGLLNEQKQAIIHRAVTRGLDPNAKLKPSGIPWLGEIPERWEVQPLKGVSKIQSGITLGKDYAGEMLREYPYLRVANVQAGHADISVVKKIAVTRPEAVRCLLQAGDVLMTEGGDPDKLGRGCVWDAQIDPCIHQNHVFAVRPNQSLLLPHFLSALMGTVYARAYFQSTSKQTTNLASTNKTKIGQFKVLLPPTDEQAMILDALHRETSPVNTAIARTEREIALMQEYRTRLTADIVTGKLDVREAAAKLPEEVDEEPLADEAAGETETETEEFTE
ncbi:MAG: restriction endonuclease subunit S [Verrucomicrobia bacterium]|nr:restriction endonuclease subunit S [Verrucomicrobiota bacterium]